MESAIIDAAVPDHRLRLSPQHHKRLRWIFGYGRTVHVSELGGIDLDLLTAGLVARGDHERSSPTLKITPDGENYLYRLRQERIAIRDIHDTLAERLATHLRSKGKLTWTNLVFSNPERAVVAREVQWTEVRPDVFACEQTNIAANAKPEVYEVKVSRADFLAELANPKKQAAYAELAAARYFCCPDGLLTPPDMPDGVGLVCELAKGEFVLRKRARRKRDFVMKPNTLMTLVFKRGRRPGDES